MAQFDVYRNRRKRTFPLLLDVQAELLSDFATRVVVPMMLARNYGKPISRINPIATVGGKKYVLVFQELAAIPAADLRDPVDSLESHRADLIAAIDCMFTGI